MYCFYIFVLLLEFERSAEASACNRSARWTSECPSAVPLHVRLFMNIPIKGLIPIMSCIWDSIQQTCKLATFQHFEIYACEIFQEHSIQRAGSHYVIWDEIQKACNLALQYSSITQKICMCDHENSIQCAGCHYVIQDSVQQACKLAT